MVAVCGGDSYKTNADYRHYYYIYYFTVSHKFELKTHHRYLPATAAASGPAISIHPEFVWLRFR